MMIFPHADCFWTPFLAEDVSPEMRDTYLALVPRILDYAKVAGFSSDELAAIRAAMLDEAMIPAFALVRHVLLSADADMAWRAPLWDVNPLYDLILLMLGLPEAEMLYERNGWTRDMFHGFLREYKIWSDHCLANTGSFGISRGLCNEFYWLASELHGSVLRFGRLQCNASAVFFADILVLKNSAGEFVALTDGDFAFDENGLTVGRNAPAVWHSSPVDRTEREFVGHVCRPDGYVERSRTAFSRSEWSIAIQKDDPVINVHIPADGPMLPQMCMDSFVRMKKYFLSRGVAVKAFICISWLLDPQLDAILGDQSNIVRFQKFGRLLPHASESDAFQRVFGFHMTREEALVMKHPTSMQRKLADFLRAGGHFRPGRFFIPADVIEEQGAPNTIHKDA